MRIYSFTSIRLNCPVVLSFLNSPIQHDRKEAYDASMALTSIYNDRSKDKGIALTRLANGMIVLKGSMASTSNL
ncbi:MAG TPA: hypothetical protein VHO50_00310 [Bacteroidales bacterium]|nr:hypothetical protein [Bacteroidales bacterium]